MDGVAKLFCAKNIWFLVGAKWNSHYHHLEILEHCIKSESYLLRLPCTGWLPPDFQDPHVSTSPENYHQVRRSLGFFHIVSRTLRFGWARTSCCGSHGIVNRLGGGSSKSPSHLEEWGGVYVCVCVGEGLIWPALTGTLYDNYSHFAFSLTHHNIMDGHEDMILLCLCDRPNYEKYNIVSKT